MPRGLGLGSFKTVVLLRTRLMIGSRGQRNCLLLLPLPQDHLYICPRFMRTYLPVSGLYSSNFQVSKSILGILGLSIHRGVLNILYGLSCTPTVFLLCLCFLDPRMITHSLLSLLCTHFAYACLSHAFLGFQEHHFLACFIPSLTL